jgi:ABC-type Fe3+/spermidine/putrescine transport system ATPase subunit
MRDVLSAPESMINDPSAPAIPRGYIEISNVTKRFGSVMALESVSLSVAQGEFMAILGPSGSGKTTLFMVLGGFERADSGRVIVDGVDLSRTPPHRRHLGIVFQQYALFPQMSVAQNTEYGMRMQGKGKAARAKRTREILEMVGMADLADRPVGNLSGGQQQRVALARTLAPDPRVILMDEPLGALDKALREQVQLEIRRIHKEMGATIVYVTHDQHEAMVMADRVAVMKKGKTIQVATPTDLYNYPTSVASATFVGHMNLVPGRILSRDGSVLTVHVNGLSPMDIPLAADMTTNAPVGADVRVGVRPEHLQVTRTTGSTSIKLIDSVFEGPTQMDVLEGPFGQMRSNSLNSVANSARARVGDSLMVDVQHALIFDSMD